MSNVRRVSSPWRCGPGILRVPHDIEQISLIHYRNRLKSRTFHKWHLTVAQIRCRRLLDDVIELKYQQSLLKRAISRWRQRVHTNKCLRFVCNRVQRLRLTTFDAIAEQCSRFKELNDRTAWLIFAIRFNQLKLCRRAFDEWRHRVLDQKYSNKLMYAL